MANKSQQTILCVDDDPKNLELLEALLSPEGYALRFAGSGESALEKVVEKMPDLILLDIMMPGLSGIEVLNKLRSDEKTRFLPVVFLTALHAEEDKIRGIEAGCDDFISKPFDKNELLARVRSLLRISFYRYSLDEKEKFETVIQGMSEGVIVCSPDGKVTSLNPAARRYLNLEEGLPFSDFIFKHFTVSLTPEDLADLTKTQRTFDIQRQESDTFKALYLEAVMDVLKSPDEKVSSVVLVIRDVTGERKEEFLSQDFLSLIAHKFNTPLCIVKETLDLIKPEIQKADQAHLITVAEAKLHEIHELSQRIIFILEVQNKHLQERFLIEALYSTIYAAKEKLEKKYGKHCIIIRDVSALRITLWEILVLEELLDNAFKFHKGENLQIRLTLREDSLEFSDNGPGIPPEEQTKIFDPFYQVYKYFDGNIPGIGLGLTLVKKLVDLNKGRIELESEIGKGTRFKIYF